MGVTFVPHGHGVGLAYVPKEALVARLAVHRDDRAAAHVDDVDTLPVEHLDLLEDGGVGLGRVRHIHHLDLADEDGLGGLGVKAARLAHELGRRGGGAGGDEDGVIAGERAERLGEGRLIDGVRHR